MPKSRRRQVAQRAKGRCEYCHLPQSLTTLPYELDHIRAQKHHGQTTLANLCWACAWCNASKGPNAAGYDPVGGDLVRLFNPRVDDWPEHFFWDGPVLMGRTAIGRATIDVLRINARVRVELRRFLFASGHRDTFS